MQAQSEVNKRETTEKYKYKPTWMDRAKRAEGGGMADSDGEMYMSHHIRNDPSQNELSPGEKSSVHDILNSADDDTNLARGRMPEKQTDDIAD